MAASFFGGIRSYATTTLQQVTGVEARKQKQHLQAMTQDITQLDQIITTAFPNESDCSVLASIITDVCVRALEAPSQSLEEITTHLDKEYRSQKHSDTAMYQQARRAAQLRVIGEIPTFLRTHVEAINAVFQMAMQAPKLQAQAQDQFTTVLTEQGAPNIPGRTSAIDALSTYPLPSGASRPPTLTPQATPTQTRDDWMT